MQIDTCGTYWRSKFHDFDEMAYDLQGWDIDILQLGKGSFKGEVSQFGNQDFLISSAFFGRKTQQRGGLPPGFRTFGIKIDPGPKLIWRKKEVPRNGFMAFPMGSELDVVAAKDMNVYTVSINDNLLGSTAEELSLEHVYRLFGTNDLFSIRPKKLEAFSIWLHQVSLLVGGGKPGSGLAGDNIMEHLTSELPRKLLAMLDPPVSADSKPLGHVASRALNKADQFIQAHLSEPVTVYDLCKATSASERTLQYAFKERFGVSPKQYLKALRLNGVHKELAQHKGDHTKVGDVASRWGFWHMSQFAKDYHQLFGELPSETLAKTTV